MRYWCLITSKENWEVCKRYGLWGLDYRYYITLSNFVKKGDKAIVYSHGGNFVAGVEIDSDFSFNQNHIGWEKKGNPFLYPYRVKIKIIKEGNLHISFSIDEDKNGKVLHSNPNPIDNITFIADKGRTWNIYFQVSMLPIPKEDYEFIFSNL